MTETLFAPSLDPAAATPLHQQLLQRLREAILTSQLSAGERLPSSRSMATRLNVSRNTVLAAYEQLAAEGYLESRKGAGTYVTADLPDNYLEAGSPDETASREPVRSPDRPLSGMPALDQFPFGLWGRLAGSVWRHGDVSHLQYNDPAGYYPLRRAVVTYLQAARGVAATPDQVMIVSGLQQGLRIVAESVIAPDRALIMEDPGYPGLLHSARTLPHPLCFTGIDAMGAKVPMLGKQQAGMLTISPSRQYPLGMTMPLSRRLDLLEWARTNQCLILEDDYDSEFRYAGRPLQSLQGLDGGRQVIYGGSFSKALFLSLRLGYLVLPPDLAGPVIRHRARTEAFPAISSQLVLTRFIEEGHFARHLRRLRAVHKARLAVFIAEANRSLARYFDFEATDAGLHVVAFAKPTLEMLSDKSLAGMAHAANIGAVPLSATFTHAPARQGLLFGFANMDEREIGNRLNSLAQSIAAESGF